jgi:UDP-glucuronate decarboxylase
MTIRWITELLGTAPALEVRDLPNIAIVDVRDLVDKAGNRQDAIREKIFCGVEQIRKGIKTVVCCDYGISRSNAVAAGIIAVHQQIRFVDAVKMVQLKTGENEIKLDPLDIVRQAVEGERGIQKKTFKRKILVTGGRGFIGAIVCKALEKTFEVISPSRQELDIEKGATQLSLLVAEYDVECIIHLANPRVYTSNLALGSTLTMLRNVLEVCASHHISMIFPSSWEIYSGYAGQLLADEQLPAFARGPYGDTKLLAEALIRQFQITSNLCCAILRSSPLYGIGSDKPKFIYNFLDKATRNETIVTHHYLNGEAELDLLHVDDFAAGLVAVCEKQYSGILNFGTGITTSTKTIAELIRDELGSNSRVEQTQINSTRAAIAMNHQKATDVLGWKPQIPLSQGLKQLLQAR